MAKCTWKDCTADATVPMVDKDGKQWAHLCGAHVQEFQDALNDPRKALRAWSLAMSEEHRQRMDVSVSDLRSFANLLRGKRERRLP